VAQRHLGTDSTKRPLAIIPTGLDDRTGAPDLRSGRSFQVSKKRTPSIGVLVRLLDRLYQDHTVHHQKPGILNGPEEFTGAQKKVVF
jgi:hypothetical protein